MSDDVIVNGDGEDIPGHRILDGTDLEIAYNLRADDLIIRVNKAGVQIFRVLLEGACKTLDAGALINFNSISPDFMFKVGDTKDRMFQIAKSVGLDDAQLTKLEAKLASMRMS